jgi:hypothetical protein
MKQLAELHKKLLSIDGRTVSPQPDDEDHVALLLEKGQIFHPQGRKYLWGELHRCHQIAALQYAEHHVVLRHGGICELVTGYALGEDNGMWHQHSWLWDGKRVIEPNNAPKIYFGVILAPEEASHFFFANVIFHLPGMAEILSKARVAV